MSETSTARAQARLLLWASLHHHFYSGQTCDELLDALLDAAVERIRDELRKERLAKPMLWVTVGKGDPTDVHRIPEMEEIADIRKKLDAIDGFLAQTFGSAAPGGRPDPVDEKDRAVVAAGKPCPRCGDSKNVQISCPGYHDAKASAVLMVACSVLHIAPCPICSPGAKEQ